MRGMNIRKDLQEMFKATGWTPSRLSRESGVPVNVITRYLKKEREMRTDTLEKLWPYIYGDKRPKDIPEGAA